MFVASMPPKKLVDAFQEGGFDEPVLAIIVPNSLQDVPSLRAIIENSNFFNTVLWQVRGAGFAAS